MIKVMEGMAEGVIRGMLAVLSAAVGSEQAQHARKSVQAVMAKYDYNEYGGAPLLGVDGICIISHGASSYRGIMNAIRAAGTFSKYHLNEQITQLLRARQR